jgi:hypothetical protein
MAITFLAISSLSCAKSDEQLLSELSSSDSSTRVRAALELLDRDHPAAERAGLTDWLVTSAAGMLDEDAQWTNRDRARDFYDALKKTDDRLVIDSLVRHLFSPDIRLRVLYLAMKLGTAGSEQEMVKVLSSDGDVEMAEDFLNSGSVILSDAAEDWAARNGYEVYYVSGGPRVSWGAF